MNECVTLSVLYLVYDQSPKSSKSNASSHPNGNQGGPKAVGRGRAQVGLAVGALGGLGLAAQLQLDGALVQGLQLEPSS